MFPVMSITLTSIFFSEMDAYAVILITSLFCSRMFKILVLFVFTSIVCIRFNQVKCRVSDVLLINT